MGAVPFIFKIVITRDAVNGFCYLAHYAALAIEVLIEMGKQTAFCCCMQVVNHGAKCYNSSGVNVETVMKIDCECVFALTILFMFRA